MLSNEQDKFEGFSEAVRGDAKKFYEFEKGDRVTFSNEVSGQKEKVELIKTREANGSIKTTLMFEYHNTTNTKEQLEFFLNIFPRFVRSQKHETQKDVMVVTIDFSELPAHRTALILKKLTTILNISHAKLGGFAVLIPQKTFFKRLETIFTIKRSAPLQEEEIKELNALAQEIQLASDKGDKSFNNCNYWIAEALYNMDSEAYEQAKQYFKKIETDNVFYSDAQLRLGEIALGQSCGVPTIISTYDGSVSARYNEKELLEFTTAILEKFKAALDRKKHQEKSTHLFDALRYFTQSELLQAQCFSKILFSKYKQSFNLGYGLLKEDAALKDIFLNGSWEDFQARIHIARMSRRMSITTPPPPPVPSSPKAFSSAPPAPNSASPFKPQLGGPVSPPTPPQQPRRTSASNITDSASPPASSRSPRTAFGGPKPPPAPPTPPTPPTRRVPALAVLPLEQKRSALPPAPPAPSTLLASAHRASDGPKPPPPRTSVTASAAAPSVQQPVSPFKSLLQERRASGHVAPVVPVQKPTPPTSTPPTGGTGRSSLLADIRKGKRLKKV